MDGKRKKKNEMEKNFNNIEMFENRCKKNSLKSFLLVYFTTMILSDKCSSNKQARFNGLLCIKNEILCIFCLQYQTGLLPNNCSKNKLSNDEKF